MQRTARRLDAGTEKEQDGFKDVKEDQILYAWQVVVRILVFTVNDTGSQWRVEGRGMP